MRFHILADLHIGIPGALPGIEFFPFAADLARRAAAIFESDPPDQVVIVGDLVNAGGEREFALANQIFSPHASRVRVVPGNHDVLASDASVFESRVAGARLDQVEADAESVRVFLNTAIDGLSLHQWHGRLSAKAFQAVDEAIEIASERPLLLFMHHPPSGTVRTLDETMMTCVNAQPMLDRLRAWGCPAVIFTGHNHCGDVWRDRNLTVVGLPSICFWPHAFIDANLSDGLLELRERRLFANWQDSPHERSRGDEDFRRWAESSVPALAIRLRSRCDGPVRSA